MIQAQIKLFTDAQALIASMNSREVSKSRYKIYKDQINASRQKIEGYSQLKASLYQEYAEGKMPENEFLARTQECAAKADEMRIFVSELEKEAQKYAPEYVGSEHWTEIIREYGERTELDEKMIDAFIDEIVLFNDGHYEVKFNFRDEMEAVLLYAALRQKEARRYVG